MGTSRSEFTQELDDASERKKCRSNQKKIGEALITSSFQVQLETANQWDRWIVELESNCKMIIGAKGIALSYVIRENDAPDLSKRGNWEEKARLSAPHAGNTYTQDKLTVHNLILLNIADGSDAYTYVKPHIR